MSPTIADISVPVIAMAILADPRIIDPRITALCRWVLDADIVGLRHALDTQAVALSEARADTMRIHEDFLRMRALHADRTAVSVVDEAGFDTIDEELELSDAVPLLSESEDDDSGVDEETARRASTLRLQRPVALRTLQATRV